tara:strand:+ start:2865 stop:3452 length:588 start_codon:yes stop_codon:yes gene_type:complete
MKSDYLNNIIQKRRSIFPSQFNNKPISDDLIKELLNNANMAPTHKLTQPWRFKVLQNKAKEDLGNYLSEIYISSTNIKSFSKFKNNKIIEKCKKSSAIIVICMQRDPNDTIPEWEEIASTSMAVQNIWLTCTANNIGCYWSTPKSIENIDDLIDLNKGERCLGFMYLGHYNLNEKLTFKRDPINKKVKWIQSIYR